ncbi:uncharacterized protein LOC109896384 isoform X3 [Oncorhynchus kisutch]|uniref:uncharacterized protein LOC109896384 isoform X3 n=1 Tax=Oncorhynchus kisutch TaxID=8019 RepID=UPI0012DC0756|nr:uncharacterized protein LOC109896384 isoform X3 [Oncorhynchus kisutch]
MIQPVLLLLLLAAMSSPVFGTEISVLDGTSVTLVCTYLGDKTFETSWGRYCGLFQFTDPIMEDKSKYKINAEVGTVNLTILKLQPTDRGSYCCRVYVPGWFNDLKQFYSLRVVKGCVRDLLDEVHFLGNNIANQPFTTENASQCRQECTKNDICQYFTFVDENAGIIVHRYRNKCFLKASTGHTPEITIQHLQHATSGYSLRNCSGKVTYSAKKYSLVPEKKNWTEAQEYCRQHYTNLAIIHTEEDWKAIQTSLVNCAAQRQYMCQRVRHGNGTTEKVYELMPGTTMWQDAVTDCRTIKGRELASICNQKEQEAFDELTTVATWIGLKHNNKRWEWSNREPFPESEPTWVGRNCQQLNSDRKCTPKDCSNQSAFFCYGDERPLNTTGDTTTPVTPETTSPTSTGPPSIKTSTTTTNTLLPTTINGQSNTSPPTTTNGQSNTSPTTTTIGQSTTSTSSGQLTSLGPTSPDRKSTSSLSSTTSPLHPDYLHYFNESKSWINALEFCKSRGSNLVHITNQTVQTDLTQLLANVELPCGGVWIGLERSIFEWSAPWLWTSGDVDKVVKYREWHNCFPLNPMNYHCGKMVRVGNRELKWLDASCHQELPFICQDLH